MPKPVKAAPLTKLVRSSGAAPKIAEGRGTSKAVAKSGLVPAGDVRLTVNIRGDLHRKLKIRAAEQRTTAGESIEQCIEGWK